MQSGCGNLGSPSCRSEGALPQKGDRRISGGEEYDEIPPLHFVQGQNDNGEELAMTGGYFRGIYLRSAEIRGQEIREG